MGGEVLLYPLRDSTCSSYVSISEIQAAPGGTPVFRQVMSQTAGKGIVFISSIRASFCASLPSRSSSCSRCVGSSSAYLRIQCGGYQSRMAFRVARVPIT